MSLVILSLSCLLAAGSGRGPLERLPDAEWSPAKARHLLLRAGFGGTAEEVQRLYRMGLEGAVAWLVDYEARPDVVGPCPIEPPAPIDFRAFRRLPEQERRKLRNERRRADGRRFQAVRAWWVERMLRTRRPLEERMTLFWHGHFTSSYRDVRDAYHMLLQNETLRAHATGNFGELLHAITRDPAMLEYLDNNRNRKGRPNENYAREVMELFTLGLGNYTEQDIKEAARAFTGYTFRRGQHVFVFDRRQHDDGIKTIFGKQGRFDGDDVCDLLLAHPACAPFVAGKIFAYFAYRNPEPELVRELGDWFRACHYEIKPLLRRIFMSRAFYSERAMGTQVKSPVVLLVSTIRMFGMNPPPGGLVVAAAGRLGQALMLPPNVKGWEGGRAWITTATLLERGSVLGALFRPERIVAGFRGRRGLGRDGAALLRALGRWDPGFSAAGLVLQCGARTPAEIVDRCAARFLVVPLSAGARARFVDFLATRLGGPGPFDPARLQEPAVEDALRTFFHLLCSTPEFQLC